MSTITFNWAPFEIETAVEARTKSSIKSSRQFSREEEFRTALDCYVADYRKNRRIMDTKKLL